MVRTLSGPSGHGSSFSPLREFLVWFVACSKIIMKWVSWPVFFAIVLIHVASHREVSSLCGKMLLVRPRYSPLFHQLNNNITYDRDKYHGWSGRPVSIGSILSNVVGRRDPCRFSHCRSCILPLPSLTLGSTTALFYYVSWVTMLQPSSDPILARATERWLKFKLTWKKIYELEEEIIQWAELYEEYFASYQSEFKF